MSMAASSWSMSPSEEIAPKALVCSGNDYFYAPREAEASPLGNSTGYIDPRSASAAVVLPARQLPALPELGPQGIPQEHNLSAGLSDTRSS
jgi:hypothetical protein